MSELDDFLTPTLTRQLEAEQALINGDPGPRLAIWSTREPVTIFGADRTTIGSEEVTQAFHWLATRFSNLTDYRFELVAAGTSGDLAYTLGYEHIVFSIDGVGVPARDLGCAGATSHQSVTDNTAHERPLKTPAPQLSSVSIGGRWTAPVL